MRVTDLFEDLNHSRRILFHKTREINLGMILSGDCLDTKTSDVPKHAGSPQGISLTRSYQFAQKHGQKRSPILVLDATFIPTKPVAYWSQQDRLTGFRADEMEEFCKRPIVPLSRYIISINSLISFEEWLQHMQRMVKEIMPGEWFHYLLGGDAGAQTFVEAVDNRFHGWEAYWNAWTPIRSRAS